MSVDFGAKTSNGRLEKLNIMVPGDVVSRNYCSKMQSGLSVGHEPIRHICG